MMPGTGSESMRNVASLDGRAFERVQIPANAYFFKTIVYTVSARRDVGKVVKQQKLRMHELRSLLQH